MSARGFNQVVLLGTLTKDPELRHSNSGKAYLFFDLACNYSIRDGNGGYKDAVDYISLTAFEKTAEIIAQYCVKGSQLFVTGKLRKNKRQDKNGNDIYETQVVVQEIRFAGGRRKDDNSGQDYYQNDDYDPFQSIDNYAPGEEADVPF